MYLPPAEPQKAAEHRPPFSTGSEMPLPRALGVCGEEEGELGFDVVRGSLRCVEPGWSRHMGGGLSQSREFVDVNSVGAAVCKREQVFITEERSSLMSSVEVSLKER